MKRFLSRLGIILLGIAVLSACSPASGPAIPSATATPAQPSTFTDPFEYCAAVQTIDKPDARYTGDAVPEAVLQGYLKAADLQNTTEPADMLKKSTFWRCMNGQVLACSVGANLPCWAKANTDKTPTQAMKDYCTENPASEFIPMAVTGHETVYDWRCVEGAPQAGGQFSEVDSAGYIANIWYTLTPEK
ncbi:MAG: hypothetical protein IT308_05515 [Anaerolineaceae bacterium]|nr:hypothetical protein [Anaerolineaceae bacterium]